MNVTFIFPVTLTVPREYYRTPKGYAVTQKKDWVENYGPALSFSFKVLKVACAAGRIAGFPLLNLNGFAMERMCLMQ